MIFKYDYNDIYEYISLIKYDIVCVLVIIHFATRTIDKKLQNYI